MHKKSNKEVKLEFPNAKNEPISGVLRQNNTTKPLLVICHGYGSSMEHPSLKEISESLFHLGYNTFVFNFSNSAQLTALENQVSDIETIAKYFTSYKKIVLVAGSLGALTAAIATPKYNKINGLITVNGFFGKRYLGSRFLKIYLIFHFSKFINRQHKKILQYMDKEFRPDKITIPVLVIHSSDDKDVLIKQSYVFYENLKGSKKFHELKEADHDLLTKNSVAKVVQAINSWMQTTIG